MLKYYEFLKAVKDSKIHTRGEFRSMTPSNFRAMVSETVPFVFFPTEKNQPVPIPTDSELDLPFKSCFFEMLGTSLTSVDEGGEVINGEGLLVYEVRPREYNMFLLICFPNESPKRYTVYALDSKGFGRLSEHILGMVRILLDRLNVEEAGFVNPRQVIKAKVGGEKIQHRISKLVYVCPKKARAQVEAASSKEIDWSHRFEVRGHWRRTEGVGKDREGNYCVEGYTWVREHVRGPEHLPLVKKTRVVLSE